MHKIVLMMLVSVGALVAFVGYCAALVDWIQDFSGGVYHQNLLEAFLETSGLIIYTYLGFRFFNRTIRLLP